MSAHEVTITLIGSGLTKYSTDDIVMNMNKRHEYDWCYDTGDIYITDNEIQISMETKNCEFEKVIKNVKQTMTEVNSIRYWCKPYWMNTVPTGSDIEMAFWTKDKNVRKECFYDARVACCHFSVMEYSWTEAWERYYKQYCDENNKEYNPLKPNTDNEFKDSDGDYDSDSYCDYLNERYDCLDWAITLDIENELYDSFVAYTTPGERKKVTIWIH